MTDEMLMAYADSELDREAQKQVEAALASDPALRDRLEIFIATGSPLAKLFGAPMREAVPPHLLALFGGGTSRSAYRDGGDPIRAGIAETIRKIMFGGPSWAGAVAWSVPVLLIVVAVYWHVQTGSGEPDEFVIASQGQLFAQGALDEALNTGHSGSTIPLGGHQSGATLSPILTFRNHQHEFCRQYSMSGPDGGHAGLACRRDDSRWRLDIHNPVALHSPTGNHVMPAGRSASTVEDAVSAAMDGDALGAADEDVLIRDRWRR